MDTWQRAMLAAACGLVMLAGPAAGAQPDPAPQKGGVAVIGGLEPQALNAVTSTSPPDVLPGCILYEGLVAINDKDEAVPALATAWDVSPDGRTYTFRLREARFHDGKPFTSEDVRFTLAEVASRLHPTFAVQVGKNIDTVAAPDPRTAVVTLKQPYGPFLRTLSCPLSGGILPAHLYKGTDVAANRVTTQAPVGTGPFKLGEWARGDHLTLVRNDDYWAAGKPYLDSVVVKFLPNPASRTQALRAGEIDLIGMTSFPVNDARMVGASAGLKLEPSGWPPNQLWAFLNLKRQPLSDVRVRQALLRATDRQYIFANAFSGRGLPGTAPFAKQIAWAADPTINYDESFPFDPEKAGQLLDAAGYRPDAGGVRFRLSIAYDSAVAERNQAATAMQAMWRRAGVAVELRPLETAVLLPRIHRDADFDVYISSYNSYGDPAIGNARAFVTETIGRNFGNASGYSNPEVDALFAQAAALTTLEERGAVYRHIQQILARDMPALTLHENKGVDAASRKLHGIWGWSGDGQWNDAWLEP